jgi:nicotinamide mononucleotide transporter
MDALELVASLLGVCCVWLTVRQNIWCWPSGAVMVTMFAYIFYSKQLYADAGLQVIYFVLQFYGWYQWRHGGLGRSVLGVQRAHPALLLGLSVLGTAGTLGLGFMLGRWTNQALPYPDSAVVAFSLIAQWMMAKKLLENWMFWFGVDVLAVGIYHAKDLVFAAALYGVFLVMAVFGHLEWRKSLVQP